MLNITVELENTTTDEDAIVMSLPMEETDIRGILMKDCKYLIVDTDSPADFKNFDDIFELNKAIRRICEENPTITNDVLAIILETSDYNNFDDEDFLEKICENDFMYEEAYVPKDWHRTKEEYAAFVLCTKYDVPFALLEQEMIEACRAGKSYPEWDSVWDVYAFMGFHMSEDMEDENKIYIVNMEDSE